MKPLKQQFARKVALSCKAVVLVSLFLVHTGCDRHYHPVETHVTRYTVDDLAQNNQVDSLIGPYRIEMQKEMDVVIGSSIRTLTKGEPESSMGNWVADAVLRQSRKATSKPVDLAIQNRGGLRINELAAGDITMGKVFEVMPFDNMVTLLTMSGAQLQTVFDEMAADGGWPISFDVRYVIENKRAKNVRLNGAPISPSKRYTMALPDYVANGGGGIELFEQIEERTDLDLLVRDAIIMDLKEMTANGKKLDVDVEGRVTNPN